MPRGNIKPIRRFRGVDLSKSPRDLDDDQLALAQNLYEETAQRIATRPQTKTLLSSNLGEPGQAALLASFNDKYGQHWLMWWQERAAGSLAPDGYRSFYGYLDAEAGTVNGFAGGFPLRSRKPTWLKWNNKIILFPGVGDAMRVFDPGPNRLTAHDNSWRQSGAWATNAVYGNIAETYRNMICIAGVQDEDSTIYFMQMDDPATPYNLLPPEKSLWIKRGDGDRIVGLKQVAVMGGAEYVEPYLLVFKQNSSWVVRGDPPTVGTNGTMVVTPLMEGVGCVAKETIVGCKKGIIWASADSVWLAPPGGTPIDVGAEIRPLLRQAARNSADGWHATFFNGIYRLTIPAAGVSDVLSPTEQWWLDLRDFNPGQEGSQYSWWGPMTLPASASHVEQMPDGSERLVNLILDRTVGSPKLILVEGDVETDSHMDATTVGGYTTGLVAKAKFKAFDFGDPLIKKVLQAVEAEVSLDGGDSQLRVSVLGDEGSISTNLLETTGSNASGGIRLGFTPSADLDTGATFATPMESHAFHSSEGRIVARSLQPVITVSPSSKNPNKTSKFRLGALGIKIAVIARRPAS